MPPKKVQINSLSDKQLSRMLNESENEYSSSESETDGSEDDSEMASEDNLLVNNRNNRRITGEQWFNNPRQNQQILFIQNYGLKVQTTGHDAIDYFNLLVSNNFYNLIVEETNLYAVEILSKSSEDSRISYWKDLTVEELTIFLGLVFHTGTIRLNKLEDYWRIDDLFDLQCFRKHEWKSFFIYSSRTTFWPCR